MTAGTPVICRLGGDEGPDLVGAKGTIVSIDDVESRWVNVNFEEEVVTCYLTQDWRAEADDWKDPGGWFITDCTPVVETVTYRLSADVLAGLAILGVVAFASLLIGIALVLR